MTSTIRALVAAFLLAACQGVVPLGDDDVPSTDASHTLSWDSEVAALLADCTNCHGSAGNYSLESYEDSLGPGEDTIPNVIPGDTTSKLIQYSGSPHGDLGPGDVALIRIWVLAGAVEN